MSDLPHSNVTPIRRGDNGKFLANDDEGESFAPELLTSQEVSLRTGASYRQIDYWTRRGYVAPVTSEGEDKGRAASTPGSGYDRRWSHDEAVIIRRIIRYLASGLNLPTAAAAARCTDAEYELAPGVTIRIEDEKG